MERTYEEINIKNIPYVVNILKNYIIKQNPIQIAYPHDLEKSHTIEISY